MTPTVRSGRLRSAAQRLGQRMAGMTTTVVDRAVDVPTALLDTLTDRQGGDSTAQAAFAANIHAAAKNHEMYLVYQPETDLRTGEVIALEALLRWHHPDLGEVAPESFISLAEKANLLKILGAWILDESLREFASWSAEIPALDVTLRVNVSPSQLADPGVVAMVATALDLHRVAGDRLCVEVTEHVEIADTLQVDLALTELRGLGVTSALDDLASGFNSLGRLRALSIDTVKIDRTLVTDLDRDTRAHAIVDAVIRLAGVLDLDVVAEGVERVEEADALVALGCHRAQGHLFGRPMNSKAMHAALVERGRRAAT